MDKKALSLPILISLVVGNMIGTGIYVLPASLAEYGSLSLLAWLFTSLGALFLALTFARLSKRFPQTGGPYIYCKKAFGRLTGFIIAYTYWISYLVSIAGIAVSSIEYLGFITPTLNANSSLYDYNFALIIEIGVVWLFTFVNILGVHTAGIVQLFLTLIKITPLIIISIVGLGSLHLDYLTPFSPDHTSHFTAVSSAAALTFWAFIGLESATVPAENTQGYRDIFKATVFGTLITAIIYIISTFILMAIIPNALLKTSQFPFAEAGTMLFGHHAALLIALCAVISALGALNVSILIQGQIVFAAARDRLFPRLFAKLSKRDVPMAAQLLSSSLITVFLIATIETTLLKQFNNIALLAGLLTLITYFVTTLSELKFLFANKKPLHYILLSKSLIVTGVAAAYTIWMISSFNTKILSMGMIMLLLCIPIYFFTVRKYVHTTEV